MFADRHSSNSRPGQPARGYFLFELVISALMIAAIVVLAFPTYQDFTPETEIAGENVVEIESARLQDVAVAEESDLLSEQQAETTSHHLSPAEDPGNSEVASGQ
jgi:Tfp pilus assembly protein PilE